MASLPISRTSRDTLARLKEIRSPNTWRTAICGLSNGFSTPAGAPYDQDWLDYQHEIALRHTALKKNKVDRVESTSHVPLRDIIAFIAVMNETIKPYLAAKGDSAEEVEKMHRAWCKSIQPQLALWANPYMAAAQASNEW